LNHDVNSGREPGRRPSGGEGRAERRDEIRSLVAKYDRPGPRYTSYPTAVEFSENVGREAYETRLSEADQHPEAPLSIYLHLPFCAERCLFCGCHVIATEHRERTKPYLSLLAKESALVAERLPHRRRFAQLHLGGGTPTYYSPQELTALTASLLSQFEPVPDAELAVEVDPRVTDGEHIDALAAVGFNRVSMGVQDFDPAVQERIHRRQSPEQTSTLIERARERGYRGINVDLIYGLPLQTATGFERTLEQVIDMGADRVAVYSFAYVPWMRGHQKKLNPDELPSNDAKLELFAIARERLLNAGYEAIGMDHFAKPDDELSRARKKGRLRRNFQGYAVTPGDDVIALGLSGIGDVRGLVVQNSKKLSTYGDAVERGELPVERGLIRSRDDAMRSELIEQLMCNFDVEIGPFERRWGITFGDYFACDLAQLAPYVAEGLVSSNEDRIRATPLGEMFVRNLAMCFDRYMREKHGHASQHTFSRTV